MACTCIDAINGRLAEHNSRLVTTFVIRYGALQDGGVKLQTEKINTRNRDNMGAIATFCPFCGVRYEPAAQAQGAGQ